MEYRIGEFARHMGISPELLKHYERLGLVTFRRDDQNGYRYCDFSQCENLLTAKALVTGRLSLKDNAFASGSAGKDVAGVVASLEDVEREFERELTLDRYAIARTRELKEIALQADAIAARAKPVSDMGPLYFLKMSDGEVFCERGEQEVADFARWRDCCPVTSFSLMRNKGDEDIACGLAASADFATDYGLPVRFAKRIEPPYFAFDVLVEEGGAARGLDDLLERCTTRALANTSIRASSMRSIVVEHFFYAGRAGTRTRFARVWLLV